MARTVRLYDTPGEAPYVIDPEWATRDGDAIVGVTGERALRHEVHPDGTIIAETCVSLIAEAMAAGFTVTREARTRSPNGLAWPGVAPPWRTRRPRPVCKACSTDGAPTRCRRRP